MNPDALRHPRGPLPASTYWRRRVVLILVVLALLLLLGHACGGGGSRSDARSPAAVLSRTPTSTSTPTPSPSPSVSRSPAPAVAPACTDRQITVTAATDASVYTGGQQPHLQMTVTNTSTRPCRQALGRGARELKVVSGADRIWSSDDCSPGGPAGEQVLPPGKKVTFAVVWDRQRSAPGCPTPRDAARHGTYRLYARVGGLTSGPAVFSLH